jgi:hypothetical protein
MYPNNRRVIAACSTPTPLASSGVTHFCVAVRVNQPYPAAGRYTDSTSIGTVAASAVLFDFSACVSSFACVARTSPERALK